MQRRTCKKYVQSLGPRCQDLDFLFECALLHPCDHGLRHVHFIKRSIVCVGWIYIFSNLIWNISRPCYYLWYLSSMTDVGCAKGCIDLIRKEMWCPDQNGIRKHFILNQLESGGAWTKLGWNKTLRNAKTIKSRYNITKIKIYGFCRGRNYMLAHSHLIFHHHGRAKLSVSSVFCQTFCILWYHIW